MKKRNILFTIFILLLTICTVGLFACGGNSDDKTDGTGGAAIKPIYESIVYRVGDNVDFFDFIEREAGVDYEFSLTVNGEKAETEGRSYYLATVGEYELTCKSSKGTETVIKFTVLNKKSFMTLAEVSAVVNLNAVYSQKALMALSGFKVSSDVEHEEYVESVIIYNATETLRYDLTNVSSTPDGFYVNKRFNFIYECEYVFTFVSETTGGKVSSEFSVTARETFDMETLTGNVAYDAHSKTVTWDKATGAVSYRIKIDQKSATVIDDGSPSYSLDITPYLIKEFQYFDLYVVAKNADGIEFGKYVVKDVVIAPEGSENLVIGKGAQVNAATQTATLSGIQYYDSSAKQVYKRENSYIAFVGDYGLNTYLDITFKGNNLPVVCFFANDVNGRLSSYDNDGYMLVNGLYVENFGTSETYKNSVIAPHRFLCIPGRLHADAKNVPSDPDFAFHNYITVSEQFNKYVVSENSLFTQNGLNEDSSGRTYRYVVGAYASRDNMLGFECKLYNALTNELIDIVSYITDKPADEVVPSNILVMAAVKGRGNDTTFGYTTPYESEPEGITKYSSGVKSYVINGGGSTTVTLAESVVPGAGYLYQIKDVNSSYVSLLGNYGVGTFMEFSFKGNNMPNVMFFANEVNGNMTGWESYSGTGTNAVGVKSSDTGMLFTNGLVNTLKNTNTGTEAYRVYGADRIYRSKGLNVAYLYATDSALISKSYADGGDYMKLTQRWLSEQNQDTEYTYIVGTYDNDGKVAVYVLLKAGDTVLAEMNEQTTLNTSEIDPATMGNIVLYGAVKGSTETSTFTYKTPYTDATKTATQFGVISLSDNPDGGKTVALAGHDANGTGGVYSYDAARVNQPFVAFSGDYGVGTYIDITYSGNNMPQIMFFADKISGDLSSDGGNGLLMSTGRTLSVEFARFFTVCNGRFYKDFEESELSGKTTAERNNNALTYYNKNAVAYIAGYNGTPTPNAYPLLTLYGQNNHEYKDDAFKLTIGTFVKNGKIYIDIILYDETRAETLYDTTLATTVGENDVSAGSIVLYAPWKGNYVTTFTCSAPYVGNTNPNKL